MENHKQNSQKRHRPDSDSENELENEFWPRYLVISSADEGVPLRISPFAVQKGIEGIAGKPDNIKRMQSGDLIVQVSKRSHAQNLLNMTEFVGFKATCSPHTSLNYSKGILRCRELADCSEDEILTELKSQGVVNIKRFSSKRDGVETKTNTYLITFCTSTLPDSIKIGYMYCKIQKYVPNPQRCFKCQRYGHTEKRCRQEQICGKCGGKDHDRDNCENEAKCVHCAGNHNAGSRVCLKWKEEKEILTLKTDLGITFPEAKRIFFSRVEKKTYAQATKNLIKTTMSVETQTDIVWVKDDNWTNTSKSAIKPKQNTVSNSIQTDQDSTVYREKQDELNSSVNKPTEMGRNNPKKSNQTKPPASNGSRVPKPRRNQVLGDGPIDNGGAGAKALKLNRDRD